MVHVVLSDQDSDRFICLSGKKRILFPALVHLMRVEHAIGRDTITDFGKKRHKLAFRKYMRKYYPTCNTIPRDGV